MSQVSSDKHKAVIFDLDGTLIDSAPDIAAAVNRVMVDLAKPELSVEYVEGFIGDGSRSMLKRIFEDLELRLGEEELSKRLSDYMDYYAQEPARRTRFFDYVLEDIRTLHSAGIKLGVCTNKPNMLTELVLEELGIAQFFSCVLGADAKAVTSRKPDAAHLLAVVAGMGEAAENILYVGDTEVDRTTAHNANIPFFVVKWGGGRFLQSDEGVRIERLADLLAYASCYEKKDDCA